MCKNAGGYAHGINKTEALLYTALCDCLINLRRDINELLPVLSVKPEVLGVGFHTRYLWILFTNFKNLSAKRLHSFRTRSSGAPIETGP